MPFPIAVIFIPFPHVLSHIWYSFPSQTHCHKGVDDKVCFLQEKKKKGCDWWCLHTVVCTFSWLFWLSSCFLPWHCVRMLYSALLTDMWRLCSFVSAFLQGLSVLPLKHCWVLHRPSAWQRCAAPRFVSHIKPSSKSVFPALTSFLPSLSHLSKGFPVRTYRCYGSFQPLLIPVLETSGDWVIPTVSKQGHSSSRCSITNTSQS